MNRQKLIERGKIWQFSSGEEIIFEGAKTNCVKHMKEKGIYRLWKKGKSNYHLCQLIWEAN